MHCVVPAGQEENESDRVVFMAKTSHYSLESPQPANIEIHHGGDVTLIEDVGIDSCCSEYILKDRHLFETIGEINPLILQTANGIKTVSAGGPAELPICNEDGTLTVIKIPRAYFNEDMTLNFLPIMRFYGETNTYETQDAQGGHIFNQDGARLFGYKIHNNVSIASRAYMTVMDSKWHARLAHKNPKILERMKKLNAVTNFDYNPVESVFCEGCAIGKHVKTGFAAKKSIETETSKQEVHIIIWSEGIRG